MKDGSSIGLWTGRRRADAAAKSGPARTTRGRHLAFIITKRTVRAELHASGMRKRDLVNALDHLYKLPLRQPPLFHPATISKIVEGHQAMRNVRAQRRNFLFGPRS